MILTKIKKEDYNFKKFKDLKELQKYYKKNKIDDMFILNDSLYQMNYYDTKGELLVFKSIEADHEIAFITKDRYKTLTDLKVEDFGDILSLRQDLEYYYTTEVHPSLKSLFEEVTDLEN